MVIVAPAEADETRLAELEGAANAKQHRARLEARGPIARVDIIKKLNVTDAPIRTLVKKGLAVLEHVVAAPDELLSGEAKFGHATPISPRIRAPRWSGSPRRWARDVVLRCCTASRGVATEVYLRLIEAALERGKGAIVLVPEIALTPQTVGWFLDRFGAVAVLHSGMTDVQRLDMWQRVRRGEARVVVGARSAIFAPVRTSA